MRAILLAFIIAVLSFPSPQQAHACSCAMPGSLQESIDAADVIFSGTVDDIRAGGERRYEISVTVDQAWKGLRASEQQDVTVYTATSSAACGYAFEEGEAYLVYAYRDKESGDVSVGLCSATKPLERADDDVALLSGDGSWACTMDAKVCPDGSYVGRDHNNHCAWHACPGEQQACTKELKICPDGTGVGRTGPNCTFAPCPGEQEPSCKPYVCTNGETHPRCAEDGSVINYFAPPCHTDGGEAGAPFEDVSSDHPNADAIFYVKEEGVVEGYSDGTYRADTTINRAEFVKILIASHYETDDMYDGLRQETRAHMIDVEHTSWYEIYAHFARWKGVIDGYPDGTFRPANAINFAEAAKILTKAFDLEASTTIPACDGECPWYRSYVLMLEMRGAIPTSIVRFDQNITRGEMAEMIYRLETGTSEKSSRTYAELQAQADCDARVAAGHPCE